MVEGIKIIKSKHWINLNINIYIHEHDLRLRCSVTKSDKNSFEFNDEKLNEISVWEVRTKNFSVSAEILRENGERKTGFRNELSWWYYVFLCWIYCYASERVHNFKIISIIQLTPWRWNFPFHSPLLFEWTHESWLRLYKRLLNSRLRAALSFFCLFLSRSMQWWDCNLIKSHDRLGNWEFS